MSEPGVTGHERGGPLPESGTAVLGTNGVPSEALLRSVRSALASASSGDPSLADIAAAVTALAPVRGHAELARVAEWVHGRLLGLGPLQVIADRPGVTDVLVGGDGRVWVDGVHGLQDSGQTLGSEAERRTLAVRLLALGGRRLDDAQPFGDVVLGRYRVHAAIPPVSVNGTSLSIRVLGTARASLEELFPESGTLWRAWLQHAVDLRLNMLISGGTGAGKTTLLAALLASCPASERLVIVEDAHELEPRHPHAIALQARQPNAEGRGEVGLGELVRQALRMRPDRLVVGECRGAEVRDMMMAMNTGHDGAAGTVHANSVTDVPARLIALGALAGWDSRTTAMHAAAAFDLVVHVARTPGGRGPVAMARLLLDGEELRAQVIARADASGGPTTHEGFDWFASTQGRRQ